MEIAVLGPVEVRASHGPVQIGSRLRRLLAALVIHHPGVVDADALADIVWSGEPPPGADRTLRTYVSRLRSALGATDAIVFRQSGYALDVDAEAIDAHRFERELDEALRARARANLPVAEQRLAAALGRWSGRAYGGFGDEDWARPEALRLEERRCEALEAQVDVLLDAGRAEHAVAEARAITEAHPLRERPRALLMRALYATGRRAEASRVFADYRTMLGEETGLEPSDELAQLEGTIVRGDLEQSAGTTRGYRLLEELGRGSFATVHRAIQPGLGREVAVKVIRPELADQPEFIRRFDHEAQLVASVEHPHVVPLHDFWREPGAAYLVMRLMRGGTVAELVRTHGALSRDQACRAIDHVGGALVAAHRAGVIHRDVRPGNLLRDEDGVTYLADFGVAIRIGPELGTSHLHYAAPELIRAEPAGPAADILSLAVTTFELLTGRVPFADTSDRAELVRRQLHDPLPPISASRTDLRSSVDEVLARATTKVQDDRYQEVEQFVDDLLDALGGGVSQPKRSIDATRVNPYVGLRAFTEADAERFHGRERITDDVLAAVGHHRLVVVVGPSGSGKSSIVRAGVLPAIRRGAIHGSDRWLVTVMVPGTDPIAALEEALLRIAIDPPPSLREQLREPGGLQRTLRRILPDGACALVVIDQFEELFTMGAHDEVRRRFLAELATAVDASGSQLRILATLRADHYDAPLRDHALAQAVTDGTVTVRPMGPDDVERAIVRPAEAVGVRVEPALVADLVAGVSAEPASLPLLQFALTELYSRRTGDELTLEAHRSLGGLTGALAARADRIVERGDDEDRERIRRAFGRLVTFGASDDDDVRRRASLAELDDERTRWLIDEFVSARLLVVDRDERTREPTVEVAHEALLRDWPRLRTWIEEDRADLRTAQLASADAHEWAATGDDGALARGGRLELVGELADRRPDLIDATTGSWIDRSRRLADEDAARERQHQRRIRRALVTTAALLVLALTAASIALVLRARAAASERAAEARELILEADLAVDDDPELAILLGLEAIAAYEDATGEVPVSALQVLRAGTAANTVLARLGHGTSSLATRSDGRLFAMVEPDGSVVERDATLAEVARHRIDGWSAGLVRYQGDELHIFAGTGAPPTFGAFVVASGSTATPEKVAPDGAVMDPFATHVSMRNGLLFRLRIDRPELSLEMVALSDGEVVGTIPVGENITPYPTLTDDEGQLLIGVRQGDAPGVLIVDLEAGERIHVPTTFASDYVSMSPDGRRIAVARQDGEVEVRDIASGELVWAGPDLARARVPTWSPDGRLVVTGAETGLTVLDATSGQIVDRFEPIRSGTEEYGFVGDGRTMVSSAATRDDVVVSRLVPPDRLDVTAVAPGLDSMEVFDDGSVLLSDRRDAVVVRDGEPGPARVGTNDGARTNSMWTRPFVSSGGWFTYHDGRSHLVRASDGRTVWTAPDGWGFAGLNRDGSIAAIHRWDGDDGETRLVRIADDTAVELAGAGVVTRARFARTGGLVATMPIGLGGVRIFDVEGGLVREISDEPFAGSGDFSPDGTVFVLGTFGGDVIGYDVELLRAGETLEAAETLRIDAHDAFVRSVRFSPDGTMIATSAQNEPARLWSVETGELLAEFSGTGPGIDIDFHPTEPLASTFDGRFLTTHLLRPEDVIAAAEASVTRSLTEAECERYLGRGCDPSDDEATPAPDGTDDALGPRDDARRIHERGRRAASRVASSVRA